MKLFFLLLAASILSFSRISAAGTKAPDSVSYRLINYDSLNTVKNIIEIRQLKYEILRRLRDDRYNNPSSRASIDSGIVLLVYLTDSIQKSSDKDEVLDCKLYLNRFLSDLINGDIPSAKSSVAIQGYLSVMQLARQQKSIFPAISQLDPVFCHPILTAIRKKDTPGWKESTGYLVCQTFSAHPTLFLKMAFEFPEAVCIDSLLPAIARQSPDELYRFSQASSSELGRKIMDSNDDLVKLITKLAGMRQGRVYYPFLDDLYHKKITLAEIDKKTNGTANRIAYYQLLVKTLVGYNERIRRGDMPIAMDGILEKVSYNAEMDFVRVMNGLHDAPDNVRLKVLQGLNPQELYYLCINGEKDLYTSSYIKLYNSIFAHQRSLDAYKLLRAVNFDHFRRFIKMAGTYNTLDDFLARMPKGNADTLMHSFIDDLGSTTGIEEVIDVANSYASIRNDSLRRFILKEVTVKMETEKLTDAKSSKIYTLLNTLFLSLDPANNINLTKTLGIPDVYQMTQSSLKDSSGRILIQQFFYGDPDGKIAFNTFLQWLKQNNWQIKTNKYWIEAISKKGTQVHIYANLPLDNNTGQDDNAQTMLRDYLSANNLSPSIIIHRGHSYYANNTIKKLTPGNKLIIMGSCGSFSQISSIYKYSPQAQMITSKQEGSVTVNQPMIGYIIDLLVKGQDLNWPGIWDKLAVVFKKNARFDDYIPPYQNLGAVLLMTGIN